MATSSLNNTRLLFTTNGTTIACQATASADTLTLVGASSANIKLTGIASPTSNNDAATKQYVDNIANGISWKNAVRVATTTAGTLSSSFEAGQVIDGITLSADDRILIKDQTSGVENGIYIVQSSGAPTRASDLAAGSNAAGIAMFVEEGTTNADTAWVCSSDTGSAVVGTDSLSFIKLSSIVTNPGGNSGDIQYNSAGSFGGISQWSTNGTTNFSGSGTAVLDLADSGSIVLGTGSDLTLVHNGTDSTITSTTGNLVIDNTNTSGSTVLKLGTSTSNTTFNVQNSSSTTLLEIQGNGLVNTYGRVGLLNSSSTGTPSKNGSLLEAGAQTFTDNNTSSSGTAAAHAFGGFAAPTLAAANSGVTTTNAATVYIGGAPVAGTNQTITNSWALWAESGNIKFGGDVYGNSFNSTSDARMKTNFSKIDSPLDKIMKIEGYEYNWKDPTVDPRKQIGVIAQQLEEIGLGDLVSEAGTHKAVNYLALIPLLIEAVKELTRLTTDEIEVDG